MARGFYVTGTDTGVGKTLASACLVHALRARGLHVAGMKPVASGCVLDPAGGGWHNDDALALQAARACPSPTMPG
jgi:dethiobiotin synthetase